MRSLEFGLTLVLVFIAIASCTPPTSANTEPADKEAANSLLVRQGILRVIPDPHPGSTILAFGPALLSQTGPDRASKSVKAQWGPLFHRLFSMDALILV